MIWFLSFLPVIFLLVLVLCLSSVVVIVDYGHNRDDDHFFIQFRLWYIIRHTIKIPVVKVDREKPGVVYEKETKEKKSGGKITPDIIEQRVEEIKAITERVIGLKTIAGKFIQSIRLSRFEWYTVIGLHDAAWTGIAAGSIWAAKGGILSLLTNHLLVKTDPVISVTPSFQNPDSETHLKCMFKIQIGKAILAGYKVLKYWRGGRAEIGAKPISNPEKDKQA
ncbi:hypothetical protein BpJC4_14610 [Weizmannia acidilactici]|nr:hypothetical protein BpJC4_14610 [Weizmannia acidilactici]